MAEKRVFNAVPLELDVFKAHHASRRPNYRRTAALNAHPSHCVDRPYLPQTSPVEVGEVDRVHRSAGVPVRKRPALAMPLRFKTSRTGLSSA